MPEKYLVLVCDDQTNEWSIAVDSDDKEMAYQEHIDLKEDGTPTIFIATGDFITI